MGDDLTLVPHGEDEAMRLQAQVDACRAQLAGLETECTLIQKNVQALRATLFQRLAARSEVRDKWRLLVRYRADLLASLRRKDEESVEAAAEQFRSETKRTSDEYARAAQESVQHQKVSADDEAEIATLWRKLVKLYHPDKIAQNPEKQATYHKLIAAINHARDTGNLATLREIANDPHGFLLRQGWSDLDLEEDRRLDTLRHLLKSLQGEIGRVSALLERLRKTPDYELHQHLQEHPEKLEQVVETQLRQLDGEIVILEAQADSLKREIEALTGKPLEDPDDGSET